MSGQNISQASAQNKRIAKNTMYMYFRMAIVMFVSLYSSRVLLETLGVEDYGLYNVVGGIIAMFSFLNGAMANATSRYITFYLGKGDAAELRCVFNLALFIHAGMAVLIVLLGETAGLWYLYNKLVVPEGRLFAAEWLYQLSVIGAALSIISVPYNATIVAHEKMSAFAFISVMDVFLNFSAAVALYWVPCDLLIFYGIAVFLVRTLNVFIFYAYVRRNFAEARLQRYWNYSMFREMVSFAGWSLFGNFSYVFTSQGTSLILNAYCGPAVNAARAVVVQVETAVRSFAANVQSAINPQIIKSYAEESRERMLTLIFASSRYCYFLLLFISLPLMLETDFVMSIWLGEYPDHTVSLLRICLVSSLLNGMVNPLYTANLATGKVRIYQLGVGIVDYIFMGVLFVSVSTTRIPEMAYLSLMACNIIALMVRIVIAHYQIGLSISHYTACVLIPNALVTLVGVLCGGGVYLLLAPGWLSFLLTGTACVLSIMAAVYCFGMTRDEKQFLSIKIRGFLHHAS